MRFALKTRSRDQFIAVGQRLGTILQSATRDAPWMVHIGGTHDSGKSLIALAIDQAFNPDTYPRGLQEGFSADIMLHPDLHDRHLPVVFQNFNILRNRANRQDFFNDNGASYHQQYRQQLEIFKELNSQADVLIGANLHTSSIDFNRSAKNGLPDQIDININVRGGNLKFDRKIVMTVEDEKLVDQIAVLADDYKDPFDPAALLTAAKESFRHITTAREFHWI